MAFARNYFPLASEALHWVIKNKVLTEMFLENCQEQCWTIPGSDFGMRMRHLGSGNFGTVWEVTVAKYGPLKLSS